jgi:hypothetical protein
MVKGKRTPVLGQRSENSSSMTDVKSAFSSGPRSPGKNCSWNASNWVLSELKRSSISHYCKKRGNQDGNSGKSGAICPEILPFSIEKDLLTVLQDIARTSDLQGFGIVFQYSC